MQTPYEMSALRMKLNTGDSVDAVRAIYTLLRHIEVLEQRLERLEEELKLSKEK